MQLTKIVRKDEFYVTNSSFNSNGVYTKIQLEDGEVFWIDSRGKVVELEEVPRETGDILRFHSPLRSNFLLIRK